MYFVYSTPTTQYVGLNDKIQSFSMYTYKNTRSKWKQNNQTNVVSKKKKKPF